MRKVFPETGEFEPWPEHRKAPGTWGPELEDSQQRKQQKQRFSPEDKITNLISENKPPNLT